MRFLPKSGSLPIATPIQKSILVALSLSGSFTHQAFTKPMTPCSLTPRKWTLKCFGSGKSGRARLSSTATFLSLNRCAHIATRNSTMSSQCRAPRTAAAPSSAQGNAWTATRSCGGTTNLAVRPGLPPQSGCCLGAHLTGGWLVRSVCIPIQYSWRCFSRQRRSLFEYPVSIIIPSSLSVMVLDWTAEELRLAYTAWCLFPCCARQYCQWCVHVGAFRAHHTSVAVVLCTWLLHWWQSCPSRCQCLSRSGCWHRPHWLWSGSYCYIPCVNLVKVERYCGICDRKVAAVVEHYCGPCTPHLAKAPSGNPM